MCQDLNVFEPVTFLAVFAVILLILSDALFTAFMYESFILLLDGFCYMGIEMYLSTAYLHSNYCPFFPCFPTCNLNAIYFY